MANRYIYKSQPTLQEVRSSQYSQEEMASLIRMELGRPMGRAYYGHIETGERLATAQLATIIARILNKKVDELFALAEEEEEHEETYEHDEEEVKPTMTTEVVGESEEHELQ